MTEAGKSHYEIIVIGAGVAGILSDQAAGRSRRRRLVLDSAPDLGGTWYWNRYPGARFDSESYTYGYSFSQGSAGRVALEGTVFRPAENLRYLNFVADKSVCASTCSSTARSTRARFDEAHDLWRLSIDDGRELTCRFVIMAVACSRVPTLPRFAGMDRFRGRSFHTHYWPHEPVELAGKKVAVIGTGATAIQIIGEIADKVGELTVFQRRPNWSAPPQQLLDLGRGDGRHPLALRRHLRDLRPHPGGFEHEPDRRGFFEVSARNDESCGTDSTTSPALESGFSNFREIFTDEAANAEFSAWIATGSGGGSGIPRRGKADSRDHGFGVQRVPLETNYFEAYNRDNVHLVDISETPIEGITETGLRTSAGEHDFDIIVYSTGFDAIHRRVRSHRHQRDRRREIVGKMEGRPVDLPRHDGSWFSEFADADRAAERFGPRPTFARHRNRRQLVHRAARAHVGSRFCARRSDPRGARALDRLRRQDVRHHAGCVTPRDGSPAITPTCPVMSTEKSGTSSSTAARRNMSPPSMMSLPRAMRASCSRQMRAPRRGRWLRRHGSLSENRLCKETARGSR